jgi:hypothetical protein
MIISGGGAMGQNKFLRFKIDNLAPELNKDLFQNYSENFNSELKGVVFLEKHKILLISAISNEIMIINIDVDGY